MGLETSKHLFSQYTRSIFIIYLKVTSGLGWKVKVIADGRIVCMFRKTYLCTNIHIFSCADGQLKRNKGILFDFNKQSKTELELFCE